MAQLLLDSNDVDRLSELLAGRDKPEGVKRGTWWKITRSRELEFLEMDELRSIAECEPRVMAALGLPRAGRA